MRVHSCEVFAFACATVVHLIPAHDVNQASGKTLVAVCGELLVDASCPPGCECDHRYCPQWNKTHNY